MTLYINYNYNVDNNLFQLWTRHYNKLGIHYNILCNSNYLPKINRDKIIYTKPTNGTELYVYDYLFSFLFQENTNEMILSLDIHNNLEIESLCIPRLFKVSLLEQKEHTMFEIPDFIFYKDINHSNYYLHGLKINGGKNICNNLLCITLKSSENANTNQYYENSALYMPDSVSVPRMILGRIVNNIFRMNVVVNKEKRYGIIWNQKAACTTISNIFCLVNNIYLSDEYVSGKRAINYVINNYRYNDYLENIEYINFVRNPYYRFISTFIDKHIFKRDPIYVSLDGYLNYMIKYNNVDTIFNLCQFISDGNYISEHFIPQTLSCPSNINYKIFKIENDLNKNIYNFLEKFHDIKKYKDYIMNCKENKITIDCSDLKKEEVVNVLHFSSEQWLKYLNDNDLNYNRILKNNIELKELIYKLYCKDFIRFDYEP